MPRKIQRIPQVGVAGIGGFASIHHQALWELERAGHLRVAAASDPRIRELEDVCRSFAFDRRGVEAFATFEEMLDVECDWVSLATPIHLHASMHAACVAASLPCYLEKPPTLDPGELEAMIGRDLRAAKPTQVGFLYLYEPARHELKRRLLAGEFGQVRQVSLWGAWRRSEAYYSRSPWAGKLMVGSSLLLDSCLGNAMAHHVNNLLFFAGTEEFASWGACHEVEALLFHAHPIESADTVFLRGRVGRDIEIRVALTHACDAGMMTEEKIVCDRAVIRITPNAEILITHRDGSRSRIALPPWDGLGNNLRMFSQYAAGVPTRILGTLSDCRSFVHLNALSFISSGRIRPISGKICECRTESGSEDVRWTISGIEERLRDFTETGDFSPLGVLSDEDVEKRTVDGSQLPMLREMVRALRRAPVLDACRSLEAWGKSAG